MNSHALEAGQMIDDFRLLERLPSGGMASFWRVVRGGDDRPMLMKIPLLRPGEDPSRSSDTKSSKWSCLASRDRMCRVSSPPALLSSPIS